MWEVIWGVVGLSAAVGLFWLIDRRIRIAQAGDRRYDGPGDSGVGWPGGSL
jgi:hypothetical protein